MELPSPRGPLSGYLIDRLRDDPFRLRPPAPSDEDPLASEDLQLSLYICYELHYGGFDMVSDAWEWEPSVISLRRDLEARFGAALDEKLDVGRVEPGEVVGRLKEIAARSEGPSLSRYLETEASLERFREFVIHRSIYHLREADPHTWVIPRLRGAPKAALVEIQADEYGGGDPARMHSVLFAGLMEALGLESAYGHYLDDAPAVTLATVNLMSFFGLARSRRGAAAGHLALLEMDSSIPNRRYADGLRRLGFGDEATLFFDEHVEADSVHEEIAAHDLAGALALQQPDLAGDVVFGAEALSFLEGYFAAHLLSAWGRGRGSLRR